MTGEKKGIRPIFYLKNSKGDPGGRSEPRNSQGEKAEGPEEESANPWGGIYGIISLVKESSKEKRELTFRNEPQGKIKKKGERVRKGVVL